MEAPDARLLLHTTRSAATLGEMEWTSDPRRCLLTAETPAIRGRVAVRTDLEILRGGGGGKLMVLENDLRLGQTFDVNAPGTEPVPPRQPVRLSARESSDGDFLHAMGILAQTQGSTALRGSLWRWTGNVASTLADESNRIADADGTNGTPYGDSHHWVQFPLGVELDFGATYYFEVSAPNGWDGWRLRWKYDGYGYRGDPERSGYENGALMAGLDLPFRTYVLDVYDAAWR